MSRLTIIEGNSNDKDNVRVLIVKGEQGADGISPIIEAIREGKIVTLNIEDAEGTKSISIEDGVSPTVETIKNGKIATITITDYEGDHTFTISDGEDGADGVDGVSPTVNVSKEGATATITITDKNGDHTFTITDGQVTYSYLNALLTNYLPQNYISVLESSVTIPANQVANFTFSYPIGFDSTNCIPISFGIKQIENKGYNYFGRYRDSSSLLNNEYERSVNLLENNIQMRIYNDTESPKTVYFRLVLLKKASL